MNSSDRAEPVDNTAAQQPSAAQADVRANSTETFANLTHLPHLPHLSKSSSGYELHPTSSTSTRPPATVDGSNRPIEDTRPLRSVDAIRADLEHPHTAALTALHSTTIGDGPIGRLLRDVGPLLARVVEYDAEIDTATGVRELLATLPADAAIAWPYAHTLALELAAVERERDGWKARALEDEQLIQMRERDVSAARVERDAALARIAAVEALHFAHGRNILGKPVCAECSPLQPMPCPTLRALAASPTPERCVEFGIELWEMRCEYVPGGRHTHYPTGAPSPTPTGPEPLPTVVVDPDGVVWTQAKVDALNARAAERHRPATPEPTEETP